jgi:hypothetical protein
MIETRPAVHEHQWVTLSDDLDEESSVSDGNRRSLPKPFSIERSHDPHLLSGMTSDLADFRLRRTARAEDAAASATSAPKVHNLGFVQAGRFRADSGLLSAR